jgi:membrane protein YdbS with pleckstrin-like domain
VLAGVVRLPAPYSVRSARSSPPRLQILPGYAGVGSDYVANYGVARSGCLHDVRHLHLLFPTPELRPSLVYIITNRSLRIRAGVVSMRELTMTFSNIQEIRVTAGPVQNRLKLADVEVQAAGGGSGAKGGGGHTARFKCVSNANAVRDLMVERVRQYRDSRLGELSAQTGPAPDHVIDAARAVLAEARATRTTGILHRRLIQHPRLLWGAGWG